MNALLTRKERRRVDEERPEEMIADCIWDRSIMDGTVMMMSRSTWWLLSFFPLSSNHVRIFFFLFLASFASLPLLLLFLSPSSISSSQLCSLWPNSYLSQTRKRTFWQFNWSYSLNETQFRSWMSFLPLVFLMFCKHLVLFLCLNGLKALLSPLYYWKKNNKRVSKRKHNASCLLNTG